LANLHMTETIEKIMFVLVDNKYITTPYWYVSWINHNGAVLQTNDYETFKQAHNEAKNTLRFNPHAKMFVKTKDDEHPLDNDTQLVMDLLKYG
jgi:hypothetical protein